MLLHIQTIIYQFISCFNQDHRTGCYLMSTFLNDSGKRIFAVFTQYKNTYLSILSLSFFQAKQLNLSLFQRYLFRGLTGVSSLYFDSNDNIAALLP